MLITTQKKTAEAILNLFETGEVRGDYGNVTLIAGDTGHLTFGRSQTTLGSGNLHKLLQRYCAALGARFAARLAIWLPRFAARDVSLDTDFKLHMRASADDAVMRDTQDVFFDELYWQPAALQLVGRARRCLVEVLAPGGCAHAVLNPRGHKNVPTLRLSDYGMDIKADGIFGQTSSRLIKQYQTDHNLPVTDVADTALIARLVA